MRACSDQQARMFDTGKGEYAGPLAFPEWVGFGEAAWAVGGTREHGTPKALVSLDVVRQSGVGMDTASRTTYSRGRVARSRPYAPAGRSATERRAFALPNEYLPLESALMRR